MTRFDVPVESAVSEIRILLLRDETVIERLWALGRMRAVAMDPKEMRDHLADYQSELARLHTDLDGHFAVAELDHFAQTVKQRITAGTWGDTAPVGHDADGYGRTGKRVRGISAFTVEEAAETIVRRMNGDHGSSYDRGDASRRRKQLQRLRALNPAA